MNRMNYRNKPWPQRLIVLMTGLFLYAFGIVATVRANIGYSPWDIFHQGIANHLGLSLGNVSIMVGAAILLFNGFMKEKVGSATILNVFLIGTFIDIIMNANLIPRSNNLLMGALMMLAGLCIIGFATAFYLSAGLGAGPRDGLMLTLIRITGKDIALVRNGIELIVTVFGFLLGGPVGLGTVLTVLTMGYFVKFAFSVLKFNPSDIKHQYLGLGFLTKNKKEARQTD